MFLEILAAGNRKSVTSAAAIFEQLSQSDRLSFPLKIRTSPLKQSPKMFTAVC